jgi:hypothetical protein
VQSELLAGMAGLNPTGGMDVCLVGVACFQLEACAVG